MSIKAPIQFLFPGHGSERINMTRGLYEKVESYRDDVDKCLRIIEDMLEFDLKRVLFPDTAFRNEAAKQLSRTVAAQPALFLVEYSLAQLLGRLGIEQDGMFGHSVGEYVAACLAGVFSLETALSIVVKRSQLAQALPEGSMLAVALPEEKILPYLSDRIALGSTIGQNQCVVSGYPDSVEELRQTLSLKEIECKQVKVSRAFHSMMLDPVLDAFGEFVGSKKMYPPQKPFISCLDGQWIKQNEVQTADYWVRHLRSPVRFLEGVGEMAQSPGSVFVEVGKGSMLTSLVRSHPSIDDRCRFVPTCPSSYQKTGDFDFLLEKLNELESLGISIKKSVLLTGNETCPQEQPNDFKKTEASNTATSVLKGSSNLEKQISACFAQVLGIAHIEKDQNFLELGGNSLMAMQVIARIRKNLDIAIPIKVFFQKLTVSGIVRYIEENQDKVEAIPARKEEAFNSQIPCDQDPGTRPKSRQKNREVASHHIHLKESSKAVMNFSLFFFSGDEGANPEDPYYLVREGAKFADENGFDAIWIPERHFNQFGGLYPNPAVLGAAIAATTHRIHIRGGSVVAPLHHPVRIAEEWSVVDNLSKGRVGVAFGSGFHPKDFLLSPQSFNNRKNVMLESIETIRNLWSGGSYRGRDGGGEEIEVKLFPTPYSKALPTWLSTTRSPDTFAEAGKLGGNVLTALLRLTVEELGERISVYRQSRERAGHDPRKGIVTVMLHSFVGPDMECVRSIVETPLKDYLRSHMEHTRAVSQEKAAGETVELNTAEEEALLNHAFERYFETSSLMGTVDSCASRIAMLKDAGVDEVACLIDFGVDFESLMTSLKYLNTLRMQVNKTQRRSNSTKACAL